MPRAYSNDLRQRVIAACAAGTLPQREIAVRFQISEGTLYDWLRRWRSKGSYAAAPLPGVTPISSTTVTRNCDAVPSRRVRTHGRLTPDGLVYID